MIQCVGSRDDKFLRYCSKICCGVALKHASMIKDSYPKTEVVICYTDIRMPGLYENYLQWVQSKGVTLIKGKPLEVLSDDYRLILRLEDSLAGELIELHPDLIVLSVGVLPSDGTRKVADTLHLSLTEDGWIKQEHAKLKPVKTNVDGIFVAGMVVGPNDVGECVASARAAAEEAMELISTGKIEISPEIAVINESCDGCAYCIEPCPYNAITLIEYMRDGRIKKTVEVDEAVCTGCGICQATCPQKGVYIKGYKIEQISAMVDIALGGEICQKISK
jgi:heterodisulfide reductase subunit A